MSAAHTTAVPVGYAELVRRNHNFRYLWLGQIVSLLGDWFNLIASASLVASLTDSGLAVGGLFVVRMLAPFLVSPVAGVAADRMNRKRLLIAADLLRAVTVLGFLLVREPGHVWLLYTLTAIQLGLSGFFFPARNAILPDITVRRELGAANALSSATWSVMLALGAAAGGLVAGQWGVYPAFIIDAGTFVLSALLLARIRYDRPPALEDDGGASIGAAARQYLNGLRYLRDHPDIFATALHKAAFALLVAGAFQVVQVPLAEEVFPIGEGGSTSLGLLYAVVGVGTGLGPIAARRLTRDRHGPQRAAIAAAYVISAAGLALMAPLWSFPLVLAGATLRGIGAGIGWVSSTQLLLELVPDRVRGRVFATEFALQTLTAAIGALLGGWALDSAGLGIPLILAAMAVLILLPGALWVVWMARWRTAPSAAEAAPPD